MKRVGECKQCGQCCRCVGFVQWRNPGLIEWLEARGLDYTEYPDGTIRVLAPHVCPHLIDSKCDLHDGEKPDACRQFPTDPKHPLPGCGFSFVPEEA